MLNIKSDLPTHSVYNVCNLEKFLKSQLKDYNNKGGKEASLSWYCIYGRLLDYSQNK